MFNIAHRGYTRDWPGNTLEAIEAAIRLGVDAVEIDIQETGDGGFVLAHEAAIQGQAIGGMSMPELMGLDVGQGCRVATLEEALDLCWGEVGVVIELKDVRSVERFLEIAEGSGEEGMVGACSFDAGILGRVRDMESGLRMGLIVDEPPRGPVKALEKLGCEVIGVRAPHVTESLVTDVHIGGRMVFGWGVEDVAGVDILLGLGVDGVVSDFPDVVKRVLGGGQVSLDA